MLWIKEVEMTDSVDDLKSSCSIIGIQMPNFEVFDAKDRFTTEPNHLQYHSSSSTSWWYKVREHFMCMCHVFERSLSVLVFVFFFSLSRFHFLSHCLFVLCLVHQLPCRRNRRGLKPTAVTHNEEYCPVGIHNLITLKSRLK